LLTTFSKDLMNDVHHQISLQSEEKSSKLKEI
jgi:hypothetical protein